MSQGDINSQSRPALWRGRSVQPAGRACSLPQLAAAKVSKSIFGQNSGNSVDISKAFFELVIWKFESSQVSQTVSGSEKLPPIVAEMPTNGGLLQFGVPSLCSRFPGTGTEFRESLWLISRIFPFLGDAGRRPGSIRDSVVIAAVHSGR